VSYILPSSGAKILESIGFLPVAVRKDGKSGFRFSSDLSR
jgi:hypothetical protein